MTGPTTGTIRVTVSTTGATLDPDGYTLTLDGQQSQSVGLDGSATFTNVLAGPHTLELKDATLNCVVDGGSSRALNVTVSQTTQATFNVVCTFALRDQIAFITMRDGNNEIYAMNIDGSNPVNLTNTPESEGTPAVSPDGTRIAFGRIDGDFVDIHVMDADGSNEQQLFSVFGRPAFHPAWSPDGSRLAFARSDTSGTQIYLIDANGMNPVQLTDLKDPDPRFPFVAQPAWSPDGTKIAFRISMSGLFGIALIDVDGSGQVSLIAVNGQHPAWSPDGTKIAFDNMDLATSSVDVYVMDSDGSNMTNLTSSTDDTRMHREPVWSPDGTRIAFTAFDTFGSSFEIFAMNADGSNLVNLTNHSDRDSEPSWSP